MEGSALSAFISFLYQVFVFLVQLTIDAFFLPFLLVALLMPWRSPFLVYAILTGPTGFRNLDSRERYRETAFVQCVVGLFEMATIAICPILLLSGLRTAKLLEKWRSKGRWDETCQSNLDRCWAIWGQMAMLLLDAIPSVFLALAIAMPWRTPALCRAVRREGLGWFFQTICPCTRASGQRESEGELRARWIGQAMLGLLDALTAVPLVVILITAVRAPSLIRRLRSQQVREAYDLATEYNYLATGMVWLQLGCLLIDTVTALPLALVMVTGLRARKLLKKVRSKEVLPPHPYLYLYPTPSPYPLPSPYPQQVRSKEVLDEYDDDLDYNMAARTGPEQAPSTLNLQPGPDP